ncbi:MAG TPA: hypothetical protein VF994_17995 [Myxococcales bacterium]
MADKPQDLKPATEHGEVKVIKNAPARKNLDPGKTPGSAEEGRPNDDPIRDPAGKTPGNAEG